MPTGTGCASVAHDVYYLCHALAQQCDSHAVWIRETAATYDKQLSEPNSVAGTGMMDKLRHKASELVGRRPESGLLLLRDLVGVGLAVLAPTVLGAAPAGRIGLSAALGLIVIAGAAVLFVAPFALEPDSVRQRQNGLID